MVGMGVQKNESKRKTIMIGLEVSSDGILVSEEQFYI